MPLVVARRVEEQLPQQHAIDIHDLDDAVGDEQPTNNTIALPRCRARRVTLRHLRAGTGAALFHSLRN